MDRRIPFVHVISTEDRYVEALKGGGTMFGQDAFAASCGGMSRLVKRASSQAFHPSHADCSLAPAKKLSR